MSSVRPLPSYLLLSLSLLFFSSDRIHFHVTRTYINTANGIVKVLRKVPLHCGKHLVEYIGG